jgi:hypothetical protein
MNALFIGWGPVVRGDLNGFVVLHGDHHALGQVRFSDEFELLLVRAASVIDAPGVVPAYTGDALAGQMQRFGAAADEFGG